MKKKIIAVFLSMTLAALSLTACGDSASTADTEKTENSSSQSETTADSSDSDSTADSSQAEEKQEDKLIKVEHFTPSGELIYTQTREYVKNKNGEAVPLKYTVTGDISKSQAATKHRAARYEYDDDFKHVKYYNENNELSSEYFYNDAGLETKYLIYKSGNVNNTYLYEYDNDKNIIKETYYFGTQDKYISMSVITYSYKDGKLVSEHSDNKYSSGKSDSGDKTYEYDPNGNVVKKTTKSPGDVVMTETYTYDDRNNCTKKIVENTSKGRSLAKTETRYEYKYDGENYVKTSLSPMPTDSRFFTASKETYSGDKVLTEEIYSAKDAAVGNFDVLAETVKYTYGTV